MNTTHRINPEIIGNVWKVTGDGDDIIIGDKVAGVQVCQDNQLKPGRVQIGIRNFQGTTGLVIEFELPEIVAAISFATFNREVPDK